MENSSVTTVLRKLPCDIITFFIFCLAISTLSFYLELDINKELRTSLIPYTGWGFGRGYLSALFFILIGLLSFKSSENRTLQILRIFIVLLMSLNVYDGVQDWLSVSPEDYTNPNPYLRYDTLTPVYTIATPLFWTIVIMISLLWNYFKNKKETNQTRINA